MNKLVYKLTTAATTAALLTGSVASVAFGTTSVTISGNGADSDNTANVTVNTSKTIYQTNTADINNSVKIKANTGNNEANRNTGGDVSVETGDANVSSSVSNSANSNVASLSCGSCPGDVDVKISGNGADSDNDVRLRLNHDTNVYQSNTADVANKINVDANTGRNEANRNTGGDVEIETGNAKVEVDVRNMVNQNVASIGGNGNGGSIDVEISGNGADSDNDVKLNLDNDVQIVQSNVADISNKVNVNADTGNNEANRNTGGDVSVETGDADVEVSVTNKANFNGLNLDDCCELDLSAKISGNGADSDNEAKLTVKTALLAAQTNDFDCDKGKDRGSKGDCAGVKIDSNTGGNEANRNTQDGDDPTVSTGDAGADVEVSTQANSNVLGDMGFDLPDLPDLGDLEGWILLLLAKFSS